MTPNKQLQRTVRRHRGRAASASFHDVLAARSMWQRAAAKLRRSASCEEPLQIEQITLGRGCEQIVCERDAQYRRRRGRNCIGSNCGAGLLSKQTREDHRGLCAGRGNDITARFMAQRLSLAMGQQFIVDNKPGAGGAIGTAAGVNSPPDGYTLTLISAFYTVHPSISKLRYDPVIDITPIIQVSQAAHLIVVHPSLPARSIAELVALAKSKPGKLNYATPGQGGTAHLATELFASMAGIKLNHIPYKGTNPALSDTIGGQTDLTFAAIAAALPHVRSGKLRALAVTTPREGCDRSRSQGRVSSHRTVDTM